MNVSLVDDDASLIPELLVTGGYCADIAPPGETGTGSQLVDQLRWIDKSTLTWGPNIDASTGYRVYRGEYGQLPALASASDDSCVRWTSGYSDRTTASGITEQPTESEGGLYWYLVTGQNSFGEGSSGAGESGERELDSTGDCA